MLFQGIFTHSISINSYNHLYVTTEKVRLTYSLAVGQLGLEPRLHDWSDTSIRSLYPIVTLSDVFTHVSRLLVS